MRRATFLTVIPAPYQRQLFRALAASNRLEIQVLYYASSSPDRAWDAAKLEPYERILPGTLVPFLGASAHLNPSVARTLARLPSELVIVSDYSAPTAQIAMRALIARGCRWAFWGETPNFTRRGALGSWARGQLQRPLRKAHAIAAIGSRAVEVYGGLLPNVPVFNIPYFCDLEPYRRAATARASREAKPTVDILFSGQMIERKGVDTLIAAFVRASSDAPALRLLLLGEGPDRLRIETLVPENLRDSVVFLGHRKPETLPEIFAQADIFTLPSRHDGWGVVLNEALGAGLPIVASDAVGAAHDLVTHGENGFITPVGDVEKLAEAFVALGRSDVRRAAFATAARRRAESWGLDEAVRRWCRLLDAQPKVTW
jgi:glycosyltransferase involved in cell wall biosynthesis